MKSYDTRNWLSVLTVYRQDTLRKLWPALAGIALYAFVIDYWVLHESSLRNSAVMKQLGVIHSLLGLVISLLLVFRTNTAYDRWWEGRKQWGSLVNASRNLALKLNAILPADDQAGRSFFRRVIPLYARVLGIHLRSQNLAMELDETEHPELAALGGDKHAPNHVAAMLGNRIHRLLKDDFIRGEELILLQQDLNVLTDVCGACERIKNTPIPYSYASFIKKFILLYVLSLPWSLALNLGYWSVAVSVFVMYAFSSLELIAEEIEEPFGTDDNDLPTQRLAENIAKNIREIIS